MVPRRAAPPDLKPSEQKPNDKFTLIQVITALQLSAGIQSIAAKKLGCTRQTVGRYVERYDEVRDALRQVEEDKLDLAEAKILKHIEGGNLTACIFYLKAKGKARGWTERAETTGVDGGPIEVTNRAETIKRDMERKLARLAGGK
jgi:hypothetical protein